MKYFLKNLIIVLIFIVSPKALHAKIIYATCGEESVQDAINESVNGDTVLIQEGSAEWIADVKLGKQLTWGTSPTFESKSITIKGKGIDKTIINASDAKLAIITEEGKPVRITGITFRGPQNGSGGIVWIYGTGKEVRVDHCKFYNVKKGRSIYLVNVYGVVDHCEFIETEEHSNSGFSTNGIFGDDGSSAWARPLTLGSANAFYIEDCYIHFYTSYGNGGGDNYCGARYVFRYNDLINADCGHHGFDSSTRSTFSWEIYENVFTWLGNIRTGVNAVSSRGGTGVIFNNKIYNPQSEGTYKYASSIEFSSYRSKNTMPVNSPICDGSNEVDGNSAIEAGTASGPSSETTIFCEGKNWTLGEWTGYFAWNLTDNNSIALVESNTKDSLIAPLFILKKNGLCYNTVASPTTMLCESANWIPNQWAGYTIINQKDFSSGVITSNDTNTITAVLSGGTRNSWLRYDIFKIVSFTPENGSDLRWNPGDQFKLANGYPCLDQNGYTNMIEGESHLPQKSEPIYEWNNKYDGVHKDIELNKNFAPECYNHVKENRDYFNETFRPEYVPYPYPHPLTYSDPQGKALQLEYGLSGSSIDLNWNSIDSADSYRILRDWEEAELKITETNWSESAPPDETVYMVYAIRNSDGKTFAAEGVLVGEGGGVTPTPLNLQPNYPNPFNTTTTINYSINQAGNMQLIIYDIIGREIRVLVDEYQTTGPQTTEWDGTDSHGKKVSSGTYFYQIRGENDEANSKKMIFLK